MNRPFFSWRTPQGRSSGALPGLAASLLCLLTVSGGCSRAVDTRAGTPPAESVPEAMQDQRRRYVRASVEIGCLTRRETDPNKVAAGTLLIYRRHGFEDVMSYLTLVQTLGSDKSVQQELADGLKHCP